jgi:hypothetical protein
LSEFVRMSFACFGYCEFRGHKLAAAVCEEHAA